MKLFHKVNPKKSYKKITCDIFDANYPITL